MRAYFISSGIDVDEIETFLSIFKDRGEGDAIELDVLVYFLEEIDSL